MFHCDEEAKCEFFHELTRRLGLAVFFITHYCHGPGYAHCARHILMTRKEIVPRDLYPNQGWRIRERGGSRMSAAN